MERPDARVYQNAWFRKFARRQRIDDRALCTAVAQVEAGLVDADLGGGLVKQRIARSGTGKSGGFRTIIAIKSGLRAVFVFGFAKSQLGNISRDDERDLKALAKLVLGFSDADMARVVENGTFDEVNCDGGPVQNLPK